MFSEEEARRPALKRVINAKSCPVRLLVWTAVLILAYAVQVLVHWSERQGSD